MPVSFDVDPSVSRWVRRLPPKIEGHILRTIERMKIMFERGEQPHDMRPLYSKNYPNSFRVDSGEYRVLFSVVQEDDDLIVNVFRVGHRKDVYRGM